MRVLCLQLNRALIAMCCRLSIRVTLTGLTKQKKTTTATQNDATAAAPAASAAVCAHRRRMSVFVRRAVRQSSGHRGAAVEQPVEQSVRLAAGRLAAALLGAAATVLQDLHGNFDLNAVRTRITDTLIKQRNAIFCLCSVCP